MFTVPILILGFNRPDLLLGLVKSIRDLKPTKILVAIDGPRFDVENESDLVEQCRSIVNEIDWSCEVNTLFSESNLGCGHAVSKAIAWAFTIVDEVIVLEDDIRPSLEFFKFCEAGLLLYKNVENVMSISGCNSAPVSGMQKDILSAYPEIWGWATWKSKWKLYSFEINRSILWDIASIWRANRFDPISSIMWTSRFFRVQHGRVDTWDYQLVYAGFSHKQLHLISPTNQVINVGFDSRATHTIFAPKVPPLIVGTESKLIGEGLYNEERDKLLRKMDKDQLRFSIRRYLAKYFKNRYVRLIKIRIKLMEYQTVENRPFVSVLLPVYNGEKYIATAITTVINQIDQDYELIVSIDSSSDFSELIARKFEENDERIKVHAHVNRLGMRGNYEFLIGKANGLWLTILGQDDAMMPFAISELRESFRKAPYMTSLVSRRAYAFWSDTEQKFGRNQFIYPMGVNRASEVSSKKFLVNCLKGKSEYSQGPQLYTGSFVSQEVVLNFSASQGGELFPYPIPDVSSSASILLSTKKFNYSNLPLFIVGTSGSSTGILIDKSLEKNDKVLSVENTYLDAFNGRSKRFDTPGLGVFSSFAWYLFEATIGLGKGEPLSQINFNSAWALAALKAENTRKRRNQLEFKEAYLKLRGTLGCKYMSVQTRFIYIRLFQFKNFISKYVKGVILFATNRLILEEFNKEFNMLISIEKASTRKHEKA